MKVNGRGFCKNNRMEATAAARATIEPYILARGIANARV